MISNCNMKLTIIKKDFIDTLKYGKDYVYIKKHIDVLCEAITNKLNGKYIIKYIAQSQLFIVSVYVPKWSKLRLYDTIGDDIDKNIGKNLFITAYYFATAYLDSPERIFWNTTNCQLPGRVEYHVSPRNFE